MARRPCFRSLERAWPDNAARVTTFGPGSAVFGVKATEDRTERALYLMRTEHG